MSAAESYAGTDLEIVHDAAAAAAERDNLRSFAAWRLAPTLNVWRALTAERPVPREALDPWFADRLPFWGGFIDDGVALDVAVLDEVRLQGLPTPPAAVPQDVRPRVPRAPSLREVGGLSLQETRPAKRSSK